MKTRVRQTSLERSQLLVRPRKVRHILVAVDFSSAARRALRYAATLARQRPAGLTLLHVIPSEVYQVDYGYGPVVRYCTNQTLLSGAAQRLRSRNRSLCGGAHRAQVVVRCGEKIDEIVRAARELKSDVIVMGETQATLNSVKSTAQEIAEIAPCPVLLVRPAAVELLNARRKV